jgi:hypothetical protein
MQPVPCKRPQPVEIATPAEKFVLSPVQETATNNTFKKVFWILLLVLLRIRQKNPTNNAIMACRTNAAD